MLFQISSEKTPFCFFLFLVNILRFAFPSPSFAPHLSLPPPFYSSSSSSSSQVYIHTHIFFLFSLKFDLPGFIFHDTLSVCITLIQHPDRSLRTLCCQTAYLWRNSANSALHQASQAIRQLSHKPCGFQIIQWLSGQNELSLLF